MTETGPAKPSAGEAVVRIILSLIPVVGGGYAAAWDYARDLDRYRIQQVAAAATEAYGDDERLAARLVDDERFIDMLVVAVEAGRRTSWEAKRITMGRVLGQALTDDAEIDDDAAVLAALAGLEAVHFRLLAQVQEAAAVNPVEGILFPEPYSSQLIARGVVDWGLDGGNAAGEGGGQRIVGLTPFGERLVGWIREAHTDPRI